MGVVVTLNVVIPYRGGGGQPGINTEVKFVRSGKAASFSSL